MGHRRTNGEIAAVLEQFAVLLADQGGDRYKVRAYRNAAASIRAHPVSLAGLVAEGRKIAGVPGVGKSIAGAVEEIVKSGGLRSAEKLRGEGPAEAVEIAAAAGIPLREARKVVEALGVRSLAELEARLAAGALEGVAARTEFQLRQALSGAGQVLWADAEDLVGGLIAMLRGIAGVRRVEAAGEFRRGREVVGELAFLVEAERSDVVVRALDGHAGVTEFRRVSASKVTGRLAAGPLLSVRVAEARGWGDALVEETGSAGHLAEVRRVAGRARHAAAADEHEWYRSRGLAFVPPELREGTGEVECARERALPSLVEPADIRGDLHCHTTASDGAHTVAEMAGAAKRLGYRYLAITDHSRSLKIARGLTEERLAEQGKEIDRFNARASGIRVFKGSEVDILADGSLDFDNRVLAGLDVVIGSVHSRFGLGREEQTARVLRAVANPHLTCLGHLTGRLLLKRPGYELDIDRVLAAVRAHGKMLEINSSPDRLDIDDEVARRAAGMGIPILVNTDAHSVRELGFMRYGVQQARRAWLTRAMVVNTLPLGGLVKALRKTRSGVKG